MRIIVENMKIADFEAWSGGVDTKKTIIENGLCDEFDSLIEDCYPNGLTDTQLNDILWFGSDWVFESLGVVIA